MFARLLVLATAVAMPVVAWLSQRGVFGPDPGTLARESPTLLVAANYAFGIWGIIFMLAMVFAVWQNGGRRRADPGLAAVRPWLVVGYLATTVWMIVFAQRWYWLALAVIWVALTALLGALLRSVAERPTVPLRTGFGARELLGMIEPTAVGHWLPRWSLALHTGWLSLAAFLNTAQVVVAERLLRDLPMLPWSLLLWLGAALLLLAVNHRVDGEPGYWLAAAWGLVAVVVEQSASELPGASASAVTAAVVATLLLAQTAWLRIRAAGTVARAPA
ncbi:MAG: hypothetical protein AB7G13_20565 [Lautropia sp.]